VTAPAVTAFGGGHGLAASLAALTQITDRITAVVTVGDDGGSSGRLRRDMGALPPGDLRMALLALAGENSQPWPDLVGHRFTTGDLAGHPVGNLMLVALTEQLGDPVAALDTLGHLVRARGRVLPLALEPLDIVARMTCDGVVTDVRGQVAVATAAGTLSDVRVVPSRPNVHPQTLQAIAEADAIILGPGSWFTSVLVHLLVPEVAAAIAASRATKVVVLNLAPQTGETSGFTAREHLRVLAQYAPDVTIDVVVADPVGVEDPDALTSAACDLGARLVLADVARHDGTARHDAQRLAAALADVIGVRTETTWR
jgi:uncharacterized cofD-like protein